MNTITPITLVATPDRPYLSILTDDGKYRYDFLCSFDDLTAKGLPRSIGHKLIDVDTGATLLRGNMFAVPSSWEMPNLLSKMLKVLREASARMFFKSVARKPHLWQAWEYHDHDALRQDCPRYVYMEEVIRRFYKDVLNKEYVRRTPGNDDTYMHRVRTTERFRGEYKDYELHVKRELELFGPSVGLMNLSGMRVSYEFAAPFMRTEHRNACTLTLWFEYPIAEWPTLKQFIAEPRVIAMLDAWIENCWNDEQRRVSLGTTTARSSLDVREVPEENRCASRSLMTNEEAAAASARMHDEIEGRKQELREMIKQTPKDKE